MVIQLLGFPTTLGLPRSVAMHAPEVLRHTGLPRQLTALGADVEDLGDLALPQGDPGDGAAVRVAKVVETAKRQAEHWLRHWQPGALMLTLGGDHSTSLGTIWALSQMGPSFDVVWIDAHGDFNVLETSPTGNPHGMVLALACGLMPAFMPRMIPASCLKLWGVRDLDAGERSLLDQVQAEVLTPDEVRADPDAILSRLKPNVFLSFDCDSVEPAESPGTMTPVPGGFSRQEAVDLVSRLARSRSLLAVDIVEFHPDRDSKNLTLRLASEVAQAAVAGRLQRQTPLGSPYAQAEDSAIISGE